MKKKKEKQETMEETPHIKPQNDVDEAVVESETVDQPEQGVADESLQQKADRLEDALIRSKADFQNFQRRSTIEKSEAIMYANVELMKSFLPVLDDFERSFQAGDAADSSETGAQGFRMIYENLIKTLTQFGLQPIESLYQPFDPTIHEALLQQPCEDHPPSTVIEVVAKGYRLRERVVRPARVIVSKAVESADSEKQTITEE